MSTTLPVDPPHPLETRPRPAFVYDLAESRRVAILGGGAHAVVVADCIARQAVATLAGFVNPPGETHSLLAEMDVPDLGDDEALRTAIQSRRVDAAILGIAGLGAADLRERLVRRHSASVQTWWSAVHPNASVSRSAELGSGVAVMARAVINPQAQIGPHAVINTAAVVEHRAIVEAFAVISSNATLCGEVRVGKRAFIGAGAIVLGGVTIGEDAVVGAGSVVLKDVPPGVVVAGNPARVISSRYSRPVG
jgi:UDP-perosamine 4-acetyltransferase